MLAGCANLRSPQWASELWASWKSQPPDPLDYLAQALAAEGPQREAMWRESLAQRRTGDALLHTALLQSLPGHAGYDLATAEKGLQKLLVQDPQGEIAAVARVRLESLKESRSCVQEVDALKKRLAKVVDIEREMERNHGQH